MENNNLVNDENSIEGMTGKLDTSLSTLANHMQVLSLGAPSTLGQKKFNVHAWSTPLKSIENHQQQQQRRRSARSDSIHKMDANIASLEAKLGEDGVADDSLSNVTDLLPDQNLFEKTSDFIEYCLTFPATSNSSPICNTTAAPVSPVHLSTTHSSNVSSAVVDPTAGSCNTLAVCHKEEVISESPLEGDCLQRRWSGGGDLDLPVTPLFQSAVLSSDTDSFVLRVSEHDHSPSESVELACYMTQMPSHVPWPQRVDERNEKLPITACSDGGENNDECVCNEHETDSDTDSTLSENGEGGVDPFARCDSPNCVAVNDASSLVDSLTTNLHTHLAIDHVSSPSSDPLSCGKSREGGSEMWYNEVAKVVPGDPSSAECVEMDVGVGLICECDNGDKVDLPIVHVDGSQKEVALETDVISELSGTYETVVGPQSSPDNELILEISRSSLCLSSCTMQIDRFSMSNELEKSSTSVIADHNEELEHHDEVSPSSSLGSVIGNDILGAEVDAETESLDNELSMTTSMAHMSRHSASGVTLVEEPTQTSLYDGREVKIPQPELAVKYLAIGDVAPLVDNCQMTLHDDIANDTCNIPEIDSAEYVPGTNGVLVVSTGSAADAESTKKVEAQLSVRSWIGPNDDNDDKSSSSCDEREFASPPSSISSSLPPTEGIDDVAEFAKDVSIQSAGSLATDVEDLSLTPPPSNTDARLSAVVSILSPSTSEADSSPGGPSDDVETCTENAAAMAEIANVHAEITSVTDGFSSNELATDACIDSLDDALEVASVTSDDCYEDCVDSLPPFIASPCMTVEGDLKTPLSPGSKYDCSFANGDSEGKEFEHSINKQVEKKCDSPITPSLDVVPVDGTGITSTSAQRSPSKRDDFYSELPTTPLSSICGPRTCIAVADDCAEVCDPFRAVASASAVSVDQPVTSVQSEKLVCLPSTPARNVDQTQGQDLQTDKLSRVCDSMNRLMSLCTPMKDARIRSPTSAKPFRCENVGYEGHKIVFDCPTNLLDVSIGMLESLTALIAPAESTGSNVSCSDRNVASDLVSVAETPQKVRTQSNQSVTLSSTLIDSERLNVSDINTRLLEENAKLKKDFEEYKRKYDMLQEEYESLLKVAFTLRANENTLKKALEEYDDEARKSANRYLILKEYATNLIILQNKCLDQYEEELKTKDEELRKFKESL